MARDTLLSDFEKPSYEEWREAATAALKGAPFEKKLLTDTPEGITLQPIFNKSDLEGIAHMGSVPGAAPFVRGSRAQSGPREPWEVCQSVSRATPKEVNDMLAREIERGCTGVNLVLDTAARRGVDPDEADEGEVGKDGVSMATAADLDECFKGIDVAGLPLTVNCGDAVLPFIALLGAHLKKAGKNPADLSGTVGSDPLGVLAQRGSLCAPVEHSFTEMSTLAKWAVDNAPGLRTVVVRTHPYHDAGASVVDELGFAIATGAQYMRVLVESGIPVNDAARQMCMEFSVDSRFFISIAKLRAARLLWSRVVEAFGGDEEHGRTHIHVRTSSRNQTKYDPWVNMLRTTTETFCAAVAGAESIDASPFDEAVREADEFSARIARNTQVILREEANLGKVVDPAGGSWYVEWLTDQLAHKSWDMFREIEKKGGMSAALSEGFPQSICETGAKERFGKLAVRSEVLVGTNMHPNLGEQKLDPRGPDHSALHASRSAQVAAARTGVSVALKAGSEQVVDAAITAAKDGATLGEIAHAWRSGAGEGAVVKPLQMFRSAQMFETLRERSENHESETGARPKVFLANMGPIPQHKPRADFTRGFFEVAGFDVVGNDGFDDPGAAADATVDSEAPIAVICSTDPTYPELVPPFVRRLKEKAPGVIVVLAGYPKKQIDSHKETGVDEFIHLRADNHGMLSAFLDKIGVR